MCLLAAPLGGAPARAAGDDLRLAAPASRATAGPLRLRLSPVFAAAPAPEADLSLVLAPELSARLPAGVRVSAGLGPRLLRRAAFSRIRVGGEAAWRLGLEVPLSRAPGGVRLDARLDVLGFADVRDLPGRPRRAVQALGGLLWRGRSGWIAGLVLGGGTERAYFSRDARVLAVLGHAAPAGRPDPRD